MKGKTKTQKGITLIALIITIVILLILAAVAINAIREYDIFNNAEVATEKFGDKSEEEHVQLKLNGWEVEKYSNKGTTFYGYLKEQFGSDKVEDNGDETYTVILESGNAFIVQENGKVTSTKGIYIEAQGMPLTLAEGKIVTEIVTATIVGIEGEITWSNENNSVATISATSGESITVTAVSRGDTKITASCSGYKAEYIVKVRKPVPVGAYVEYDVSYIDMYSDIQYTKTNGWRYFGTDDNGDKLLISTAIPVLLYYKYSPQATWWDLDTTVTANERAVRGMLTNFCEIPYIQVESGTSVSVGNTVIGRGVGEEITVDGEKYIAIGNIFKSSENESKIENIRTLTLAELNRAMNRKDTATSSGFKNLTGEALGLFDMNDLNGYEENFFYWLATPTKGHALNLDAYGMWSVSGDNEAVHCNHIYAQTISASYNGPSIRGLRVVIVLSSDVDLDYDEDTGLYKIK